MSDSLHTQFRIDLADGISGPIDKIIGMLARIDQALSRVGGTDPFDKMWEPIEQTTRATNTFSETIGRAEASMQAAMGATSALGEGLSRTDASATATAEAMGALAGAADRVDQAFAEGNQAHGFNRLHEPVERAAKATRALDEALRRTDASMASAEGNTRVFDESLAATASGATEAGDALNRMGQNAQRAAEQAMSAMRAVQGTLNSGYGASSNGGGGFSSGPTGSRAYLGNVHHSLENVHRSVEEGMGRAFGAAAAGFGLIEPVHAAAEFDNTLTHIGIGLGYDGDANQKFAASYGMQINQLARATSQRGVDLADAAGFFSREGYTGVKLDAVLPTVAHIATAYNAAPEAVAKSTFALQENLGVSDKALGGALASVAIAGKQADLPFEKLAPLLPQVAAQAGMLGVKGRSGVDDLAALLAVARKSTGTEGEAVTNTRAFLQAITSPHTAKRFAEFGVDLFGTEQNARAKGIDPMIAVLQQVNRITHGGTDAKALGTLFNNQEDRAFVTAILKHMDQYFSIRQKVAGADQSVIDHDFNTGQHSTLSELTAFEEALSQVLRIIGEGFVPTLHMLTIGLHGVIDVMEWMQKHTPGVLPVILGITSGLIAFAAVMAACGAVLIPLKAGFGLIGAVLSPLRFVIGAVAGALEISVGAFAALSVGILAGVAVLGFVAYETYKHWDAIKKAFISFGGWLESWASWLLHLGSHGTPGSTGKQVAMVGGANMMPPIQLHVTTDRGVKVKAEPHPKVQVTKVAGTGRMMDRP
ncbi:phage tail tape measure protein [Asaia bogorensis]|uniref:phage tail tape measure protein n=1 Tax=Asaia bogorensis TaxID=91915 RepID=UPI000EFC317F|nr:phage tail tape measure protein [Asaia bogorensis]